MTAKYLFSLAACITCLAQPVPPAVAQGNSENAPGREFKVGQPKLVRDLPPGKFKRDLKKLSKEVRKRAMGKLRAVSFPEGDLKYMRVSEQGDIWYADAELSATAGELADGTPVAALMVDAEDVFRLHSRPGASNVLYLDFDGEEVTGRVWNNAYSRLDMRPFDPSENDLSLTEADFDEVELSLIFEIWHRVAEDFARFDIDVTTERPAEFTPTTGHVVFTQDRDANGLYMAGYGATGIGQLDVFGQPDFHFYSPAFVYYNRLSNPVPGEPTYNAEIASHEFGHNLGLSHDGTTTGDNYYYGHGEGNVSWAPIMGASYNRNLTTWSKGEYPNANNSQDDIAIIADKLGFATDDHADGSASATALVVEPNGDVLVSSPQIDPTNALPYNKGVINSKSDTDWFSLELAETGQLQITATPAWHSFPRDGKRGANLDIELTLLNASLDVLAVANSDADTHANLSEELSAGIYYLQVKGTGDEVFQNYSDYASQGMYFLEGFVSGGAADTEAPSPATMDWASAPSALGPDSITMTAVTASDASGVVEYQFTCVAGDAACTDSGWQSSPTFTVTGLNPDTHYAYKVRARDRFGNMNGASATRGATTDAMAGNQAPVANAAYLDTTAIITKGRTANVQFVGGDSFDPDGSIVTWRWTDSSGEVVNTSANFRKKLPAGTHRFDLMVTDNEGATNSASIDVVVSRAGDDGGGDDGGGDDGGGGPGKGKKPPKG